MSCTRSISRVKGFSECKQRTANQHDDVTDKTEGGGGEGAGL